MFRIIPPDQFLTSRWKNGGGVTHEIARADGPDRWLWRISIAEVARDGPFSYFPGMARILTVIEGEGMVLETPDGDLSAEPLLPVRFSGETPVHGRLKDGPIRDLNVIFDPTIVQASVEIWNGSEKRLGGVGLHGLLALSDGVLTDEQMIPKAAMALGNAFSIQGGSGLLIHLI